MNNNKNYINLLCKFIKYFVNYFISLFCFHNSTEIVAPMHNACDKFEQFFILAFL